MKKLILFALLLSGCSGCQQEQAALNTWTQTPLREATISDALWLIFILLFILQWITVDVRVTNWSKKP